MEEELVKNADGQPSVIEDGPDEDIRTLIDRLDDEYHGIVGSAEWEIKEMITKAYNEGRDNFIKNAEKAIMAQDITILDFDNTLEFWWELKKMVIERMKK